MQRATRNILFVFCLVLSLLAFTACEKANNSPSIKPDGPIVVTLPPFVSLLEPLTDHRVEVLGGSGQSAHGIELRPSDLALLASSRAVVGVGESLEGAAAWRQMRQACGAVVTMAELVEVDLDASGHDHHGHDHDHHHHGPVDPHLWLDPMLIDRFLASLEEKTWINTDAIAEMRSRVAEVDAAYRIRLEPFAGAAILTHHNAFVRIADRYGLVVADVVVPYDMAEPSPSALARVTQTIAATDVRGIFSEPQLPAAIPTRLAAESGIPLGQLDPLGTGDWFEMMNANLDELVRVLSESADQPEDQPADQPVVTPEGAPEPAAP